MQTFNTGELPLYNADLDYPASPHRPAPVQQFRDLMAGKDGNQLTIIRSMSITGKLIN
jgi:hypothetical protein